MFIYPRREEFITINRYQHSPNLDDTQPNIILCILKVGEPLMTTHTNYRAFLIHALFLSLSMSFIDVNTVAPAMLTQSGGSTFHLGLLSAIMVGMASFMQLFFATLIMGFRRKKSALLVGIYIRVTSLFILAFFLHNIGLPAPWKIYFILSLMALFSFSGAFANIAYIDILGSTIAKPLRKKLLTQKQLISSIGLIVSSLIVKVVLSRFSFPKSYSLLFFAASALLLLATVGFWMLKEDAKETKDNNNMLERLRLFIVLLKEDKNIRMYLLLINTSGIILATLPFLVVLANKYSTVDGSSAGSYLLMQLFGSLLMTLLTKKFSKTERYRSPLYLFIILASSIPLIALLLRHHPNLYPGVFILAGASTALFHIVSVGILLEISNTENRPLYSAVAGVGAVMNIVYPLLAGALIPRLGFPTLFCATSMYILLGLIAAKNLNCFPSN